MVEREVTHDPKTGKPLAYRNGKMVNEAAWRRAHAAKRAEIIAALGWEPEIMTAANRYAYTTGELFGILCEREAAK